MFAAGADGGNPAPIVLDASGYNDTQMQDVARAHGHESGFVLDAPAGSGCDWELRFWVPNHEMEMCGHVTLGAVWLLDRLAAHSTDHLRILTRSGIVEARVSGPADARRVQISQTPGAVTPIPEAARRQLLEALRLDESRLLDRPIWNASTSRVKTLVPLASPAFLDELDPDVNLVAAACDALRSTGLYPYAPSESGPQSFDARQFPRSSGYPEDPATGIAAAALAVALAHEGHLATDVPVRVTQGRAMGRPSLIEVELRQRDGVLSGLWLTGAVDHDPSGDVPRLPS